MSNRDCIVFAFGWALIMFVLVFMIVVWNNNLKTIKDIDNRLSNLEDNTIIILEEKPMRGY